VVRVAIVGSDVQTEVALMRRLQRIAALPADGLTLVQDPGACDLLVLHEVRTTRQAGTRLAQQRPERPLWLIDAGGRLSDPRRGAAPLHEQAIREVLQALHAPHADADGAPAGPALPFVEQVRELLQARRGQAVLSLDGVDVLHLDFAAGQAVPLHSARQAVENVPGLLGPGFDRLVLRQVPTVPASQAPRLPLTPLLWQTALRMRMVPRLIAPLTEATALRMRQWPDFRVLAHRHDDFRLCSLLLKQAMTATEAAAQLDMDPGAARAFFNAAYLSGHAVLEGEADALGAASADAPPPPPGTSPLARLWQRLRGNARRRAGD
jgi:hypothetical protein